jgi:hypothetical protein
MMFLRMDVWWWTDATLVFGTMPIGLISQIGYSLIAVAVMWALVRWDWPAEMEDTEGERSPAGRAGDR